MKTIYSKDMEVKYATLLLPLSVLVIIISALGMDVFDDNHVILSFISLLILLAAVVLCFWCLSYFIYKRAKGYRIANGSLETRLWAGKGSRTIELTQVKGICICYAYNTHTKVGPIKIKTTIINQGKKTRVQCLWFSLLSTNLKCVVKDMSNMEIRRCTGEEELYGFAAFSDECVKELLQNYKGLFYITSDLYEKYEEILKEYRIPSDRIKILQIR